MKRYSPLIILTVIGMVLVLIAVIPELLPKTVRADSNELQDIGSGIINEKFTYTILKDLDTGIEWLVIILDRNYGQDVFQIIKREQ